MKLNSVTAVLPWVALTQAIPSANSKPNIVLFLTDDQDRRLGSTDFQSVLQQEMVAKGVEFSNHFGTTAQCCPGRTSLLRGQFAHNTNVTHVHAPGGNYDKLVISGQDRDYLPVWLQAAGYTTEYIGKFLNGYSVKNYHIKPNGWDHMDALLDPYTTMYNTVVMSQNGETPVYYDGFHQTDVIRAKTMARLEHLAEQDDAFFFAIAPYTPHVQNSVNQVVPLLRHMHLFPEVKAPRSRNWNPPDMYQSAKGGWVGTLPLMNDSVVAFADDSYRARIQGLQGVDEIMQDVLDFFEAKGMMDNTYFVFTTDNGYHIGNHRIPAGKALFYGEDTNLPLVIRGPGIPQEASSTIPSSHVDLAPTFLDIAGLPRDQWPVFLDGESLLPQWHNPNRGTGDHGGEGNARETMNVEFWGRCIIEAPNGRELGMPFTNNSYKSLRLIGDKESSWLFTKWCTNDAELYDTAKDPDELHNLAYASDERIQRVRARLNAILMVTKSCEQDICRQPWSLFAPPGGAEIASFKQAMKPEFDKYFASFPEVSFKECMEYQDVDNEAPFFPPIGEGEGLGRAYREPTDNYPSEGEGGSIVIEHEELWGSDQDRWATVDDLMKSARNLTMDELNAKAESGPAKRNLALLDLGYD